MKAKRPRLQIIRGLPGSGKSTLAIQKFPSLMRIETDMYFTRRGRYIFTKKLNREAVDWFHKIVSMCLLNKMDFVVTGVFAAHTERLNRVVDFALCCGYDVYIKTLTAAHGNVHNVRAKDLSAMILDFLPESKLRRTYKGKRRVHFGLMDSKIEL